MSRSAGASGAPGAHGVVGQAALGRVSFAIRLTAAALCAVALGGCDDDCCTLDSFPIALDRAPLGNGVDGGGALLAVATAPDAPPASAFQMVVDTGTPVMILAAPAAGDLQTTPGGFDLYGAGAAGVTSPLRARFRGIDMLPLPLHPVGDPTVTPGGILGNNLLLGYSVEFRFGALCADGVSTTCSWMTFWPQLGADTSFLEDAGYAVLYFTLFGGGEVTADGDADFLGLRGPLQIPPTRVVLRACAAPSAFLPRDATPGVAPSPACCTAADAITQSSGVDLSLLVDTGVGPLVLSQSAWTRVAAAALASSGAPPAPTSSPLLVATWPVPIDATWSSIPRFALVNLEAGTNLDPGPCVELARSRRTEIVSYQTVTNPSLVPPVCGAPCDVDPTQTNEAQNSAAYLEVGGDVPVAIIADDEPFLQALQFDVLPEGPQIDGLVGAGALGRARLELDYISSPTRAVFSCEADAPRSVCWSASRCPQLPDHEHQHLCFDLPAQKLPPTCIPSVCPSN
jgi:hypothetical protein